MSSVENPTLTTEATEEDTMLQYYSNIAHHFAIVVFPLVFFVGVIGNVLSFIVLQSRYYRGTGTGFLLSALAVLDTLNLLTGLLRRWIGYITDWQYDVRHLNQIACQIHVYLTYLGHSASPWTLILFTVERMLAVYVPFRFRQLCSLKRVCVVWCVVMVCLCVFYSQVFVIVSLASSEDLESDTDRCEILPRYSGERYEDTLDWIDSVIAFFIPWITMAVGNCLIVYRLRRGSSKRLSVVANCKVRPRKQQRAVTAMLLSVNVLFLLSTGPVFLYFSIDAFLPSNTPTQRARLLLVTVTLLTLYYLNSSLNFLLYCLSARRFREAMASVLCRLEMAPGATKPGVAVISRPPVPSIGTQQEPENTARYVTRL